MTAPLTQPIPKKSRVLAFILAFVFGPLGFFYVGWRYGVAAIAFFAVYIAMMAIPLVGDWLAMEAPPAVWGIVHGIVVGIFAAMVVEERNRSIDRGDPAAFQESKGMGLAVMATLSAYRAVQMTSFVLAGFIIAFRLVREGRVGMALLALFIAVPFASLLAGFVYWVFSFILLFVFALFKATWDAVTGKTGTPDTDSKEKVVVVANEIVPRADDCRPLTESSANVTEPPGNPDPAHLVWIKPGTFTMGSPITEPDRGYGESPQTEVTISQGFWMSKYETTQEEYLAVIGNNPSVFTGDVNRPVEQVRWEDATNYCGKLTARERAAGRLPSGYAYRLPTEAEWEYACRAGTTTRFSYGDDLNCTLLGNHACRAGTTTRLSYGDDPGCAQLGNYAWYDSNSGGTTHPVGGRKPNAWGLYDMHGNVWEWCLDWHSRSLPGGSVTDPRGPNTGSDHVLRGGCWLYGGWECRSANRADSRGHSGFGGIGFRPVLCPCQPEEAATAPGRTVQSEADRKEVADIRTRAEKGDIQAQMQLGRIFSYGFWYKGVAQDDVEAVKWWRKAAEQKHPMAQCLLGERYNDGRGVPQDKLEAVKWYRRAAEQNDANGQWSLGLCYSNGDGVPKDEVEAVKWYRRAAEQNDANGQWSLGLCYSDGRGVPQDYVEAVTWYRKAAERNYALAQIRLYCCYYNGTGVPQDYVEAYKWLLLASAQTNEHDDPIGLERMMTPEQIKEAKRRAREFKRK